MRPARLPPLQTAEGNSVQQLIPPRSKNNHNVSKEPSDVTQSGNFPSLSEKKVNRDMKKSGESVKLPTGSEDDEKTTKYHSVPFLPESGDKPSTSVTSDNFNDAILPPTPPKMSVNGGRKSSLKRPQQTPNCLLHSQELKTPSSKSESLGRTVRSSGCKSAGDVQRCTNSMQQSSSSRKSFLSFTFKQFRFEVDKWKKTKKVGKLQEFYRSTFESFKSLNDAFKKARQSTASSNSRSEKFLSPVHHVLPEHISDSCLQQKFVGFMYVTLLEMPVEVQKILLKGIINCLLSEWRSEKTDNDLRAYFVLLQNPMFARIETYVVYAHLLRQIATLSESDQLTMVHWFRRLSTPRFRPLIGRLHQFVTLRLFPGQSDELPPMSNCGWWIPSAVKVLSLLNNANNLVKPRLVSFREFYNHTLDHIDVMAEFRQWENPASHSGFTFCQFPFILSLVSKLQILKHDQERQMIRSARDELVASIKRRPIRPPCVSQLFLNITVRRQHLLQDSLDQIYGNRKQLKKKLRVEFVGEPGYDMGGLTKEWFLLLLRKVLSPEYNTFVYNEKSRCYWFADNGSENSSDLFLVGVLMGLAVYNCITLDIRLPLICYRKLLCCVPQVSSTIKHAADSGPSTSLPSTEPSKFRHKLSQPAPSTPSRSSVRSQPVGVVPVNLDDYKCIDPSMAHGLQELLDYEGNVEEDFGLTFQSSSREFGVLRTVVLKPGGEEISVTNKNREEYVQAFLNHKLNKSVYRQYLAFHHGFYMVCSSSALTFLCAEELETLVCGNSGFDISDLKKFTSYQGYAHNDPTIVNFWEVLFSLSRDLQKKFLHFCTGSDRVPVGGMQELNFKIVRTPTSQNMLPMAHTCFNQLLLPAYGTKQQLQCKLIIAISNAEGFGLE